MPPLTALLLQCVNSKNHTPILNLEKAKQGHYQKISRTTEVPKCWQRNDYFEAWSTPFVGTVDEKVSNFLQIVRRKGGFVNTVVAIATAKALIARSDLPHLKALDIESSSWTNSLFQRMGFVRRAKTTSKPEILERAKTEAALILHHQIVALVEKHHIPQSMVINIDQTTLKYASVSNQTMAQKGSNHVAIHGSTYKNAITATFGITYYTQFLSMQLIYGGKTLQSLPRFKFSDSFSLSANEKHFSNTSESLFWMQLSYRMSFLNANDSNWTSPILLSY